MVQTIVIFAAGKGTRMGELSKDKPKHLILVQGKPFLYYLLQRIKQAGFSKIIVVIGYYAEQFEEFRKAYAAEFPNLIFVNQLAVVGDDRYGTLMPLLAAQPQLTDKNFVAINGDNLYSVRDLKIFANADDDLNYIGGLLAVDPTQYGTLVYDDKDFLVRIDEKSKEPKSNVINAGVYKFTSEVFLEALNVNKSSRGEYEITDLVTRLAQKKKEKVITLQDYWMDFGKPEDVRIMEKFIKNN